MIFKLIGESSLFIIKFSRCVTIKKQTLNYILFLCKSMFNIKLMSAVGDIIPLQPQTVITLTIFYKTKNIQHQCYLPSARMVLSLRTLCAKPPHNMCTSSECWVKTRR